ncbi:AAA family ATPase, partial [bacterium]|nr:AAA family ATPase [bacterium]
MKKEKDIFVCSECGYQSVRWLGKCPNCGQWNTFIEEVITRKKGKTEKITKPSKITEIKVEKFPRLKTKIGEFDRVVGGGIVYGSLGLLAGHPGIGKSTLLLTIAGKIAEEGVKVLYVSAEESPNQVKMRADRLKVMSENIYILSTTDMVSIKNSLEEIKPEFVVIDSIQTVFDPEIPTTPGSVTQVRENSNFFLQYSKEKGCSIFLVGHITKEGAIAGPKVLEHIVDVVLYFEGEANSNLRILRSIKNRFGPTTEIGVFSMEEYGL